MRFHRPTLLALLVLSGSIGGARADGPPRLLASWKERDAHVVAFSPDGRALVSSGEEGFRLRDATTGRVRAVLSEPPTVLLRKPVFTPDGRLLLAQVISDRARPLIVHDVKAWDVATGRARGELPYVGEHLDEGSFALSRDGRLLAFVDNSERLPPQVHTSKMVLDGRHVVEISRNNNPGLPRVKLWDVASWKEVAVVDGGLPLAFSPDGETLATGARDWKEPLVRLWDTATGRLRSELSGRTPGLWPIAFSPDGRFLASGEHGERSLWELADGRRWAIDVEGSGLSSRGPAFSPDGRLLFPNGLPRMVPNIGQGQEYHCFDLAAMPPRRLDLGPGEIIISPDGRRFASALGERGGGGARPLALHDLPSLRELGRLDVTGLEGAEFSPDGRWLALLVGHHEARPAGPGSRYVREVQLYDVAGGGVLLTIPTAEETWGNYGWKFSPDGRSIAVYYRTGSNVSRPGDPDPTDRPMNVDVWALPAR